MAEQTMRAFKWVALVALSASLGCSKKDNSIFPDPSDDPTVKVTETGNGPKSPMRFKVTKGQGQDATLVMNMRMAMMGKDIAMPPITMKMSTTVTEVTTDNKIKYTFRIGGISVGGGGSDPLSSKLSDAFKGLDEMKGQATVTDRGFVRDADFTLGAGVRPEVKQMMDGIKQSLRQMISALPDEPVGEGSKWDVRQSITQNGMTIHQTSSYELYERHDDICKLRVKLVQTAERQKVTMPNMPSSVEVELVSLDSEGGGTVDFDLTKLGPTSADMKVSSKMSMAVKASGKSQDADVKMGIDMTMRSN